MLPQKDKQKKRIDMAATLEVRGPLCEMQYVK
jgi:hypothetical protein